MEAHDLYIVCNLAAEMVGMPRMPGAIAIPCYVCAETILVAPSGFAVMESQDARAVCRPCAERSPVSTGDDMPQDALDQVNTALGTSITRDDLRVLSRRRQLWWLKKG
jgi:hypothetical protein